MRARLFPLSAAAIGMGVALGIFAGAQAIASAPVAPASWPMFHRNEQHTGVVTGAVGGVHPAIGPVVRWKYAVADTISQPDGVRWTSTVVLGDLDGDGKADVVATTPDGSGAPSRIYALRDAPDTPLGVTRMWSYTVDAAGSTGVDTYGPALADVDGDGRLDVIFVSKNGVLRALRGTDGVLLWEANLGRVTEAGPMLADLEGDGKLEVIITTDCEGILPQPDCETPSRYARLLVYPISSPTTINTPTWMLEYPYKMDSAEPVIADLDPDDGTHRKVILAGTWGGELLAVWRDNAIVVTRPFTLRSLEPALVLTPVIRTSPLLWDFGDGPIAVFGWMPNENDAREDRISAVRVRANMLSATMEFTPRWTEPYSVWKSSPTLVPFSHTARIVAGFGFGIAQGNGTGGVGQCDANAVRGGALALNDNGTLAWRREFSGEGNIRASAAVADLDGDGKLEVVLPAGCFGRLHILDAETGDDKWTLQLGPRSQGSPSLGDLDGDGRLEIVLSSYDGNVYAFGAPRRVLLPNIAAAGP